MPTLEVICLANSWKHGGRCVAGLRLDGGGWVRPVSREPEGVLHTWHYTLAGGGEAALLDVLQMRLLSPQPAPHHPENWLMDYGLWSLVARPAPPDAREVLRQSLAPGPALLGDTGEKIAYAALQVRPVPASLALVRPESLCWRISEKPGGKRRTRAVFTLGGAGYDLPLTDPGWLRRLDLRTPGSYPWEPGDGEALLTISLSEPFARDGFCYKLAAGIVVLPPEKEHNHAPSLDALGTAVRRLAASAGRGRAARQGGSRPDALSVGLGDAQSEQR